jgi:pyruvate,water dikinase
LSICDRILGENERGLIPGKNAWFIPRIIYSIKYVNFIMSVKKARKQLIHLSENFKIGEDKQTITGLYNALTSAQDVSNQVAYLHYISSGQSGAMSSSATAILDKKFNNREKSRSVLAQMLEKIDGIESVDTLISLCNVADAVLKDQPNAKKYTVQQISDYLKTAGGHVQKAYTDFAKRHGHRAIREAELRSPGWENDEKAFAQYLKTAIAGNMTAPEKQTSPDIKAIVKENGFMGTEARMLVYYASQAREGVRNREFSKSKLIKVFDAFKQAYIRLAKMLTGQGRLPDEDSIFFLTHDEIGLLVKNENAVLVKKALQRRRLLKSQTELQFTEVYIGMPAPLDNKKIQAGNVLRGTPVSRGIATGPARVVKTTEDAALLQQGEIMVAGFTDIGWSPFYCMIEGLVTEVGSALSHGGVVAREYALPLVANVTGATSVIRTGDTVTVDGEAGTVRIH